jgi:hypothetical protein
LPEVSIGTEYLRVAYPNGGAGDGGVFMPTVKEYRQQAKSCVDLAKEATNLYAKEAMVELAEKFSTAAELLEHPASKH